MEGKMFKILALPTLVFALVATLCLYDNFSGITMPVYAVGLLVYIKIVSEKMHVVLKKGWLIFAAAIMALSVSSVFTANYTYLFYNNAFMFCLTVGLVLYVFRDETGWTISKHVCTFFVAVFGSIITLSDMFNDIVEGVKDRKSEKAKLATYIGLGIVIFIPLGIVVMSLLSSADAVFGMIVGDALHDIFTTWDIILVPLFFVFAFSAAYCGMRFTSSKLHNDEVKDNRNWPAAVINTILTFTAVIYLFFSIVQIMSLFLREMTLPAGYTYAQYAREGYFELMVVCVLNLGIILFSRAFFKDHFYTKIVLSVICGCTYIMIASATYRICLYVKAYGFTALRIGVIWSLAVTIIEMAIIMVSVFKPEIKLMKWLCIVLVSAYIILSFSRPDALIASFNLSNESIERLDEYYLIGLSADAAPEIAKYNDSWADSYFEKRKDTVDGYKSFRQFNFSRYNFKKIYEKR